ncbi:MAG: hypothetical protein GY845_00125 [Planctomycetes bacterium]|nr:hypothetical protein [Planctomycetota bacterium]
MHAATLIAPCDEAGLERLCKYVSRSLLAHGSLRKLSDDEYAFKLKTPWSDGTGHIILSPFELIEKLSALVPSPRVALLARTFRLDLETCPNCGGHMRIVATHADRRRCHRPRFHQTLPRRNRSPLRNS